MNFLNPFILFGLFAAAIPILLHLLNLRKLKKVEFSTLKFLKELQKTKIKKIKLKQIILLILRTLIIIFIVLAFARPTIKSSLPFMENYAKSSSIILIDNSFSMDLSDEYGNRLNQAKNAAIEIINNLNEGDEAAVIKMSELDDRRQYEFSRNHELIIEKIKEINIANDRADLNASVKLASSLLDEKENLNKELYIISDAQNNIFDTDDSTEIKDLKAGIYFIQTGYETKADLGNLSIDSINVISEIFAIGKEVEAEAFIKNNSDSDINGVVVSLLFNGRRVSQRTVDIPAGEIRSTVISSIPTEKGSIKAQIEIEGDPLEIDNSRYFGFIIPENPKIAVNGPKLNYELINAAITGSYIEEKPEINYYDNSTFSTINFSDYDLIILSEGSPGINENSRLAEYVNEGGSLLIYSSDISEANNDLAAKTGFGELKQLKFDQNSPGIFTDVDTKHPIFEGVFLDNYKDKVIETANIYSAVSPGEGQPIIQMPGGVFLAESRLGKGKSFFIGVSADLDMSNFPLTGIFAALNYRSILYLTALELDAVTIQSGNNAYINIPRKYANETKIKIIDPNENEFFAQPADLPGGLVISIDDTEIPGIYEVYSSNDKIITNFAVNTEPSESYKPEKNKDEILSILDEKFDDSSETVFIGSKADNISSNITKARLGTELWQLMVILALLCSATELIIQKSTKT